MKGFLKSAFDFAVDVAKDRQSTWATAIGVSVGFGFGIVDGTLDTEALGGLFALAVAGKIYLGSVYVLLDGMSEQPVAAEAEKATSETPAPTPG